METKPEPDPPQAPHIPEAAKVAPAPKPKEESEWNFRAAMPIAAAIAFIIMDGCNDKPKIPDPPRTARNHEHEHVLKGDPIEMQKNHTILANHREDLFKQSMRAMAAGEPELIAITNEAIQLCNAGIIRNRFDKPARLRDGTVLKPIPFLPEIK